MAVQLGGGSTNNYSNGSWDINIGNQEFFISPNGWTETTSGGSIVATPSRTTLSTGSSASGEANMFVVADLMTVDHDYDRIDWDKKVVIEFTVARVTSDANAIAYIQLKQASSYGEMAANGIGIKISNMFIYGQSYGGALVNGNSTVTMTNKQPYRIQIRHLAGSGVQYYVNGVLKVTNNGANEVPSGSSAGQGYLYVGIHNNASAVDVKLLLSSIKIWQEL